MIVVLVAAMPITQVSTRLLIFKHLAT